MHLHNANVLRKFKLITKKEDVMNLTGKILPIYQQINYKSDFLNGFTHH